MNKINLYWFSKKGNYGNFGDELGPYIIKNLSGRGIYQIKFPRSSIKLILAYFKGLITGTYSLGMFKDFFKSLLINGDYIISVGSIIGWGNGKRIVWGSGILFEKEKIDNGTFLAVRGKYTKQRLEVLGYNAPSVFGDPALLLPLIYQPTSKKSHKLGLVPHHTQYDHFKSYEKTHGIKVINLLGDIEAILEEFYSCERIISSSLHGLIVAHAYGIPALWYEYPKIKWKGENIKFLDYLSSVDIREYEPFPLSEIEDFDIDQVHNKFDMFADLVIIQGDLLKIQSGLLEVAPFPLDSKFSQF